MDWNVSFPDLKAPSFRAIGGMRCGPSSTGERQHDRRGRVPLRQRFAPSTMACVVLKAALLSVDPCGDDAEQLMRQTAPAPDGVALGVRESEGVDDFVESAVAIEIEHGRQGDDGFAFFCGDLTLSLRQALRRTEKPRRSRQDREQEGIAKRPSIVRTTLADHDLRQRFMGSGRAGTARDTVDSA